MENNNFVIVIGRQYGSGGRKLAEELANRLGVPFYDKKLLAAAAERYGFNPDIFIKADEKKPSPLHSFLSHTYGIRDSFGFETLSREKIYEVQSNVIRNICQNESCIIVGRTADHILRDNPNMISVFLHAPIEHRANLISGREDIASKKEAAEIALRKDRDRKRYYDFFTDGNWGQSDNYHLSIDTSLIDTDNAVDLIISYMNYKFSKKNDNSVNKT